MKNLLALVLVFSTLVFMGAGCSGEAPLTEEEQAAKHNMTLEEYRDMKDAAARMNMTVEEHMKMGH